MQEVEASVIELSLGDMVATNLHAMINSFHRNVGYRPRFFIASKSTRQQLAAALADSSYCLMFLRLDQCADGPFEFECLPCLTLEEAAKLYPDDFTGKEPEGTTVCIF